MGKNRRYDHPKRQDTRAAIAQRAMRERQEGPWSPVIDVWFSAARPWPEWHDDARASIEAGRHGDEDGDNPHVWFPMRKEQLLDANERRLLRRLENHTIVPAGTLRCTCGILRSDWLLDQTLLDQANVQYMLDGLMFRDVQ